MTGSYTNRWWERDILRDMLQFAYQSIILTNFTPTDIALQMLLDGFQVSKLRDHSMTPVIFIILNLTPRRLYRNKNILLSCLIPGPKKHKDANSFLFPVVEELLQLGDGVSDVYNAFTETNCELYAHLLALSGDDPASAEAMGGKNPGNALCPCNYCSLQAVYHRGNRTYYNPHPQA